MNKERVVKIVIGPTASGKSEKALKIASKSDSVIINADSLQIYEDLPILTDQPNSQALQNVPHRLYGTTPFYEAMNASKWAHESANIVEQTLNEQKTPIIVGGTGMYIKCLTEGISELPIIDIKIREEAVDLSLKNYKKLYQIVYKNDEKLQKIIPPERKHQMIRAYETLMQTGQSIRTFFEKPKIYFLKDINYQFIMPLFDRSELYENINKRFRKIIENGAIDEVSRLLNKTSGKTNYSIFQAIGAREIVAHLGNELTIDEVVNISSMKTRHYAKRQVTWFKNQLKNMKLEVV